jgi:basic membrane protein A
MRKVLLLTLAATLTLGMATAQDYIFGINFDAGGKFDGSFNEGTWNGLLRAVDELEADGFEIDILEFEGDGNPATAAQGLRRMAQQGAELIVAPGFAQADPLATVASEFPTSNFVLIDAVVEAPNVQSFLFKEHEGSFLVGYIAGTLTQTGVVGFVGGMDIPLIRNFDQGYQEGVLAACPECRIISNYVGVTPTAWNDPATARELAATQQAQGADIIYAAAGQSGRGVIDFVNETMCFRPTGELRASPLADILPNIPKSSAYESRCAGAQPLFFIGVDSNQNFEGDTDNNPETLNHGLTSMLKRVDVAAYNAAMEVVAGTFTGGVMILGLAEGGVGYALDEYNQALIPAELVEELERITQQIIDGELVVRGYQD